MSNVSDLIATDIEQYLTQHENKSLLRFITCGSVDDGKSTLIGRLLFDSKMLFEDQLSAMEADSKKYGTQGDKIDFALLVDGLAAEREQGITIDVAYRFFSTERRKFIVADTPGHEQYTRNMITGASTADTAILMVDARHGVMTQTRRHSFLMSLIGIKKIVVAINKMDLLDYSKTTFDRICDEYREFAVDLGFEETVFIPMSALEGDNITQPSNKTPWYNGPTLMGYLETVEVSEDRLQSQPFRMPVQWVNRPNLDFRGFSGSIASGIVKVGDSIRVQPSGKTSTIASIYTFDGDLPFAVAGQSVTLTLADEIDISRGDVISGIDQPAQTGQQFQVNLVWMDDEPLYPGRPYVMKIGTQMVQATVTDIRHQVNVNTLEHMASKKLDLNSIAVCNLSINRAIAFDPYDLNPDTGGFILIDRMSNNTVAAGMINFALRRSQNIHMQHIDVNKEARSDLKGHKPCSIWLTGLSGSGKSTIANLVEKKLHALGVHTYLLDGDNVRHGLNRDLGFTDGDRVENVRRVAEMGKLMVDAGLVVISAFISPFRSERSMARTMLEEGEFFEVHVSTSLEVAESRDPKGLYKKARRGELKNFTGIDSAYEVPENPEIVVDTTCLTAEQAADDIVRILQQANKIPALD
ncbi:Bifunctional enzyme CysN/CysC [Marinomonas gallaica]|uniref:Multifunctional fusion protein n=1 Tax=Marinomonas gallaica TaxID=1806667 RepID=A0A1C3JV59_9GAMM|nr:sulfate adenylyltransferase subunit CysN [Marinomonas gallaica]SBT18936.1 Bifunctional enzyme CysN/CysC [Marinomonas gallaica]SBT21891.1 Bifunctional enzyme CysN/CysC [Marinomonas gallaica]